MKLTDILDQYVYIKQTSEITNSGYKSKLRLFDGAINYNSIDELTEQHVLDWRDKLMAKGCRNTTINSNIRHCRAIYQFAMDQGMVVAEKNIFTVKRLPEIRKKKLVADETLAIAFKCLAELKGGETWFWASIMQTQINLGIRNRQLINIKVGDLDLDNRTLFLSAEGNKVRTSNDLPINKILTDVLVEYMELSEKIIGRKLYRHEYLFVAGRYFPNYKNYSSLMMSNHQLQSMYKKLSLKVEKMTGERITGHRLRHTLASKIGSKHNVNIRVIQEWFGWSSILTAQSYVQVSLDEKRKLIENL